LRLLARSPFVAGSNDSLRACSRQFSDRNQEVLPRPLLRWIWRATALPEPRKIVHISGGRKKIALHSQKWRNAPSDSPAYSLRSDDPIAFANGELSAFFVRAPGSDRLQSNVLSCVGCHSRHAIFIFPEGLTPHHDCLLTSHIGSARNILELFSFTLFCSLLVVGQARTKVQ